MSNTIFYKIGSSAPEKNIPPDPCTNLKAIAKGNNIELTWNDPNKITEGSDGSVAVWSYSVLIRKDSGYPTTPEDGIEVCRSSVLNQYQTEPYLDPITVRDKTYYYSVFAVSTMDKASEPVSASVFVKSYKVMTVIINESDSNPATCCSYANDAIGMDSGKDATEWADFFGYKPCLFKDGQVVGYLNPNDFSKFEDGTDADITSGNAGDVMIEFPRRGVKISKSGDIVTVSMTADPDNPEFTYYAHTRGTARKDYFYLGAYFAYYNSMSSKLLSISGRNPATHKTINEFRTRAHNRGVGYDIFTFYQWTFLQVMYLLQFKNLNSQSVVGNGYCDGIFTDVTTGVTDAKGMIYGSTDKLDPVKLFGIENLWGGGLQLIDGFGCDASYNLYVSTDNFNDSLSGYTNIGTFSGLIKKGFMTKIAGNGEAGFIPYSTSISGGSSSTYYCDNTALNNNFNPPANATPSVGGSASSDEYSGIFAFDCTISTKNSLLYTVVRLSYY